MNQLKNTSRQEIKKLMKISDNLTDLNYDRFQEFETDFSKNSGEPAIYTFKGDVFQGLEAENWSEKDLAYAESRLFILRSEEHTSELQSRGHLVCRLLLEKKKK